MNLHCRAEHAAGLLLLVHNRTGMCPVTAGAFEHVRRAALAAVPRRTHNGCFPCQVHRTAKAATSLHVATGEARDRGECSGFCITAVERRRSRFACRRTHQQVILRPGESSAKSLLPVLRLQLPVRGPPRFGAREYIHGACTATLSRSTYEGHFAVRHNR